LKILRVKNRLIPGYKVVKDVKLSKELSPFITDAMKANDIGPIARARVASQIRQELGISLTAWVIGKYTGKSTVDAEAQLQSDTKKSIKGDSKAAGGVSEKLSETADKVDEANNQAAETDKGKQFTVTNPGENSPEGQKIVDETIKADVGSSLLKDLVGIANPIYQLAVPLCMVYEGSLTKAGPSIDKNTDQSMRAGVWVQTAAAQQKDGYNVTGEAVGATDWKLGNIEKGNPEIRASGGHPDTSDYASNQASPTGQYSLADAAGLGPELSGAIDGIANDACPALTNIWVGAGISLVNIVSIILTDGGSSAGDAATQAAAKGAEKVVSKMAQKVIIKLIKSGKFAKQFAKDTVKQIALIEAATYIAKGIVISQMGETHSSGSIDTDFVNTADSGTNAYANKISQQQFYGAPMQDKDLGPDNQANMDSLAAKNSKKVLTKDMQALTILTL
jgi:hypothetical protein